MNIIVTKMLSVVREKSAIFVICVITFYYLNALYNGIAQSFCKQVATIFETISMSTNGAESRIGSDEEVLNKEEILEIAQKITNDQLVRVLDYYLDDYSKEMIGFTGSHRSLQVTFQRSNTDRPTTVNAFVKSSPKHTNNSHDSVYMPVIAQESFFFEKIIPELMYGYKGEKWCPTYYLTTKNSIIIEDLKFSGYRILGEFYDNIAVLKSVLAALARFHSCSIMAEARLSKRFKHSVTLNNHFKDSITELMFNPDGDKAKWYNCGIELACALAERLGHNPQRLRKVFNQVYDMVKPSENHQNVICHGDLHIQNVMFADDKPPILIDFQIIRYAPLVTDILQYLHLNASRKFRERREKELVQYYHSVLVETIKIHDTRIEPPTLESIFKALEDLRIYGLCIACIYIPLALLNSKENKKLTEDHESLLNFIFGERLEIVSTHMTLDETFKQVVENAIIELAEKTT